MASGEAWNVTLSLCHSWAFLVSAFLRLVGEVVTVMVVVLDAHLESMTIATVVSPRSQDVVLLDGRNLAKEGDKKVAGIPLWPNG